MAVNTALHIHKELGPGDIVIFLAGRGEIEQVCGLIRDLAEDLTVFPLHSALSANEKARVLCPDGNSKNRRCIVTTNIAETSLTIPNVAYVVDTGLSTQQIHNPRLGGDMLQVLSVSQTSAMQRAGRAGRTQDGICFRLYSKESFDRMLPSNEPSIRYSALHETILTLFVCGFKRILDFDWIDPPSPEAVQSAFINLKDWYVHNGLNLHLHEHG